MSKPAWQPPSDIDEECVNICRAINSHYGFYTIESCCGHGEDRFAVFAKVHDLAALPFLLAPIKKNGWICEVAMSESHDTPTFWLRSINKGRVAYDEANTIALELT